MCYFEALHRSRHDEDRLQHGGEERPTGTIAQRRLECKYILTASLLPLQCRTSRIAQPMPLSRLTQTTSKDPARLKCPLGSMLSRQEPSRSSPHMTQIGSTSEQVSMMATIYSERMRSSRHRILQPLLHDMSTSERLSVSVP
jgi:hypothetical protein